MPVEAQSIDRSKLGVTPRAKEEDPGAMAFACCDFGCGKQTAYFQEEVAPNHSIVAYSPLTNATPD